MLKNLAGAIINCNVSSCPLDGTTIWVSSAALGLSLLLQVRNDSFCTILIEDITLENTLMEIVAVTPSHNTPLLEPDSKHNLN
jgi:hypothetical protein